MSRRHRFRPLPSLCLAALLLLPGCAVMRASGFGYRAPSLSEIKIGTPRAEVENQLGSPSARLLTRPGSVVDVYEFYTSPNPSLIRALGHLVKDVFTLFYWEYLAESRKAEPLTVHRIRIVYDGKDKVAETRHLDSFADDLYRDQAK